METDMWVEIMTGSIRDQVLRASRSSKRMATFFERKGKLTKSELLAKVALDLEDVLKRIDEVF